MYLRKLKKRRDSDLCLKTFIYLEIQIIIIKNIFNHCRKIIYDQRIYDYQFTIDVCQNP